MPPPRKILILFAHPALRKSRINRRLVSAARSVEGVTVHDLYEAYPDLMIDVKKEQQLLDGHDVILFQHPFYWYSSPAVLKEWMDLVLTYGYAYGEEGRALAGKWQASVISTGGPAETYAADGPNRFTVRQLLAPFEQAAVLCHMKWLPPFLVQDASGLDEAALVRYAGEYVRLLELLRGGEVPAEALARLDQLNDAVRGGDR